MTGTSAFRGVLSREQRIDWLRLIRAENVGPTTFRALVNQFGSATAALDALPDLARRGGGARAPAIPSIADADRELARAEAFGARVVAIGERGYPRWLRDIAAPPPILTILGGSPDLFERPAVAVVGSRNASAVGAKMAERIARGLGEANHVVVSGLARGIDAVAHRAAAPYGTVAVVAGGIDHLYPPEHAGLQADIVERGGAVLTEMPFGWVPRAQDFPRRNRIVSGMSLGIVVVEAAARSGTLHTARFAIEQGREVFAVPGSPLDPRAEGTNRLIRNGATLITTAADVVEDLRPVAGPLDPDLFGADEPGRVDEVPAVDEAARRIVLTALGPVPTAVDDIVLHTGLPPRVVAVILLELEIAHKLLRHGNQLVSLAP